MQPEVKETVDVYPVLPLGAFIAGCRVNFTFNFVGSNGPGGGGDVRFVVTK